MKKYIEAIRCEIKFYLNYRLNMVLNSSYFPIALIIYYFLWVFLFRSRGEIASYSLSDMLTYYLISTMLLSNMPIFAYYNMTGNIKNGELHYFLSRPIGFLGYYYAAITGGTIYWFVLHLFIAIPFILWWKPLLLPLTLKGFLNGILFFIIGYNLAISLGFILNLFTFFVGDPYGISGLYDFLLSLLGGGILPLEFFPEVFRNLPFKYIYYLPARAFMGKEIDVLREALTGTLWVIVAFIVINFMWKRGIKRYEAFGG